MKKLLLFLISVLLFSSFSNGLLAGVVDQNVSSQDVEQNSAKVLVDAAALETLQRSFDELQKKLTLPLPLPAGSQSNFDQAKYLSTSLLTIIKSIFIFTIDKADKLTSKKAVIAFAVIAAPFIALYCTYFDSEVLKNFFGSFVKSNSKAVADTTIVFAKDAAEGIADSIFDNKAAVAEVAFVGGVGYATISLIKGVLSKGVEEISKKAGPKIADASVWCVGLIPFFAAGIRNQVLPNFNYGIAI
ncbi:MAG: hypothetical protein GWP19_15385 [Planctomycetia bacterium]|nr:hypothetical protein [Planctomycetia bacterium]